MVVSGPSGCGKGTVIASLVKYGDFCYSVSATTRRPRVGEAEGNSYFYMSREQFEAKIRDGTLLEYTEYCGNYYGTPGEYVEGCLAGGKNVILEIDTRGAFNVKNAMPEAFLVFVSPPDMKTLESRLRGRGTEDEETIRRRLTAAKEEMALRSRYDLCVINRQGFSDEAAKEIAEAVERLRQKRESAENIQTEIE